MLLVILFHLGLAHFGSGYLGVDIFFVISGFLITGIIQRDVDAGKFSLRDFYRKRFLRIFPAMAAMLFASTLAMWPLLLPSDFAAFGTNLLSSVLYVSNFVYAMQAGYFSTAAATNPFLHTWSLSVEEQFYLVMPLVLLLRPRFLSKTLVHVAILATSFALMVYFQYSEKAFFMSPMRAWEFSVGSLASVWLHRFPDVCRRHSAVLGLVLIGLSAGGVVVAPMFATIMAVTGTALILTGNPSALGGRMVSILPLRFLGKISYSVYLWHWPIIAFASILHPEPFRKIDLTLLFVGTVTLGYLSWKLIEEPTRYSTLSLGRVLRNVTVVTIALGVVGVAMRTGHIHFPVSDQVTRIAATVDHKGIQNCFDSGGGNPSCLLGVKGGERSFIVYGDSHAAALASKISSDATLTGRSGVLVTTPACAPYLETVTWWEAKRQPCEQDKKTVAGMLEGSSVDLFIIHAYWERGSIELLAKMPTEERALYESDDEARVGAMRTRMRDVIAAYSAPGRKIVIVGNIPLPKFSVNIPRVVATDVRFGIERELGISRSEFEKSYPTERALRELAAQTGVEFVSPSDYFCDSSKCKVGEGDSVFFFDTNHISLAGAAKIDAFRELIR